MRGLAIVLRSGAGGVGSAPFSDQQGLHFADFLHERLILWEGCIPRGAPKFGPR